MKSQHCITFSTLFLVVVPHIAIADAIVAHTIYEKGIGIIRSDFPSQGEVWSISLKWSRDGDTYFPANVGLPRPWQLFSSVSYSEEQTTVLIPVAAFFATSETMLFFQEAGEYWFRVEIDFRDDEKSRSVADQRDSSKESVIIDHVIKVQPSRTVDLEFLAGLGDPDLTRAMFGNDYFDSQTGNARDLVKKPEVRAVKAIGRLLPVTREKDSGRAISLYGPRGNVRNTAEVLLALATRYPESSYAPYAAYYAGCCYISITSNKLQDAMRSQRTVGQSRDKIAETTQMFTFFQNDSDSEKAQEAFALAVQHADLYLKPRVLYQQATLSAVSGAFDDAEQQLMTAMEISRGERTIQKWVDKARKETDRMRAQLEKAKMRLQGVEDAPPVSPKP